MPGKSTYPEQHLTRSRAPVLPADADEIHLNLYRPNPATLPAPDGDGREVHGPQDRAGSARPDGKLITGSPEPSLLVIELLRIEKALDTHAANALQREDLPQGWRRA